MIPKNQFGRTGHASSRIIFGAYALSKSTQVDADNVLSLLLEYGINHIDTALMYGMLRNVLVHGWKSIEMISSSQPRLEVVNIKEHGRIFNDH